MFTFQQIEVMNRKAIGRIGPSRLPEPDLAEPFGQNGSEHFPDNVRHVRRSIDGPISEPVEVSGEIAQVSQHGRAFGPGERPCCPICIEPLARAVDRAPEPLRLVGCQFEDDVLLARAGKVSTDLKEVILRPPRLSTELTRKLKNAPDDASLKLVRQVLEGKW